MNGKHAVTISLAVGVAAVAGTVAATKSIQLGRPAAAQPAAASTAIAQRSRQLDRAEIALHKTLSRRPPKLPPLPATARGGIPTAGTAPAQRVVYVRPAPIVHTIHRPGGEHESEHGSDHEVGGFDD